MLAVSYKIINVVLTQCVASFYVGYLSILVPKAFVTFKVHPPKAYPKNDSIWFSQKTFIKVNNFT